MNIIPALLLLLMGRHLRPRPHLLGESRKHPRKHSKFSNLENESRGTCSTDLHTWGREAVWGREGPAPEDSGFSTQVENVLQLGGIRWDYDMRWNWLPKGERSSTF